MFRYGARAGRKRRKRKGNMWMMTWTALMVKMSRHGPRIMYAASSMNLDSFCNIHTLVHDAHTMLFLLSLKLCFF